MRVKLLSRKLMAHCELAAPDGILVRLKLRELVVKLERLDKAQASVEAYLEPEVQDGETEALFKGALSVVRKAVDVLLSMSVPVPVIPEVWQAAWFCST